MPKREFENPLLSTRRVPLHARFNPDGKPLEKDQSMAALWIEVYNQVNRERARRQRLELRELQKREAEWRELEDAINKLSPLVRLVLGGKQDGTSATPDAATLVPDENLRRKACEWFEEVLSREAAPMSDEEIAARERELAAQEQDLAIRDAKLKTGDKILRCSSAILRDLTWLSDASGKGNSEAAEALLQAAITATGFLQIAESLQPGIFREHAAMNKLWPVYAKDEPGWEKAAVARVAKLELGKRLAVWDTRLRPVRGSDVELPARRWARAAVRTIDETRMQWQLFGHLMNELGGTDAWVEFAVKRNWDIVPPPPWAGEAMKLKPFSAETLKDWRDVIRQMIREQIPEFHLLPEWKTQRSSAEAAGRDSPGEISNAILDDICSALKQFLPKPGA